MSICKVKADSGAGLACLAVALAGLTLPALCAAQSAVPFVPAKAPNCAVATPPDDVGLAALPGGFAMVFPRNPALPKDYTGCKVLWVVDGDRPLRLATLYFEKGTLRTAVAHDVRHPKQAPFAACAYPEGKSLMPDGGQRLPDSACTDLGKEPFYGLHLPTWPRRCLTQPDAAVCQKDPE